MLGQEKKSVRLLFWNLKKLYQRLFLKFVERKFSEWTVSVIIYIFVFSVIQGSVLNVCAHCKFFFQFLKGFCLRIHFFMLRKREGQHCNNCVEGQKEGHTWEASVIILWNNIIVHVCVRILHPYITIYYLYMYTFYFKFSLFIGFCPKLSISNN